MVDIDRLKSISPQVNVTTRKPTDDIKQKQNNSKTKKEDKKKPDDDEHELDEYA